MRAWCKKKTRKSLASFGAVRALPQANRGGVGVPHCPERRLKPCDNSVIKYSSRLPPGANRRAFALLQTKSPRRARCRLGRKAGPLTVSASNRSRARGSSRSSTGRIAPRDGAKQACLRQLIWAPARRAGLRGFAAHSWMLLIYLPPKIVRSSTPGRS